MITFYNEKGLFTFYKEQQQQEQRLRKLKEMYPSQIQNQSSRKYKKKSQKKSKIKKILQQNPKYYIKPHRTTQVDLKDNPSQIFQSKKIKNKLVHQLTPQRYQDKQTFKNLYSRYKISDSKQYFHSEQRVDAGEAIIHNIKLIEQHKKLKQSIRNKGKKYVCKESIDKRKIGQGSWQNIEIKFPNIKYNDYPKQSFSNDINPNLNLNFKHINDSEKLIDMKIVRRRQKTQNISSKNHRQFQFCINGLKKHSQRFIKTEKLKGLQFGGGGILSQNGLQQKQQNQISQIIKQIKKHQMNKYNSQI